MKSIVYVCCLFVELAVYGQNSAEKRWEAGLVASTYGVGGQVIFHVTPRWQVQGAFQQLRHNQLYTIELQDSTSLQAKPAILTRFADLKVGFAPFQKRPHFRVLGGISGALQQEYRGFFSTETGIALGGATISATDFGTVEAGIRWNTWRPYLGLGWRKGMGRSRFSLRTELGVYYLGSPQLDVAYEGFLETTRLSEDIQVIEQNMKNYSFYPHLGLSLTYGL
jgi:hypothetical protein